jgi:hypothetical protein
MATYKLTEKSFIHNRIYEVNEKVKVADDFIPGPHMIPVDAAAKAMAKKVGLENFETPNYVDEITKIPDVTKYGASPQAMNTGLRASPDAEFLRAGEAAPPDDAA